MKNKIIVLVVGILLISGSFYGGMKYGEGQNTASVRMNGFGGTRLGASATASGGAERGARGGGFVSGAVIKKDSMSVTVQTQDGSGSKIVFLSGNTLITKSVTGTDADVQIGANVTIAGAPNADGSINAQSIQVRANFPTTNSSPTSPGQVSN